ncbi:phosphatidate cytidylyltransferase, photoreceptor-specific isoform X2 [Agrilus planipennis]|uniref:Phosphatidate cytidylyltransferase n=1 Tax=Agrilus planipennis TaxID=224129 RepID=A0A7F5RIS2_AGRPL|nr:phosphatidate cytidylyltransferase, photoreceptor-specific isoform X1 [Agrilus planipennis]XP_025835904.1 phosphatidate cytidylyltransferase, photoreceptor-specific isoform X2 [Agrilus planipennis]
MSNLRPRKNVDNGKAVESTESDYIDTDDGILEKRKVNLSETIASGSKRTPAVLEKFVQSLPEKGKVWVVRGISAIIMFSLLGLVIYGGPLTMLITIMVVQVKAFSEIINIGYAVYRAHGLPWFRSLSWYFLITSDYFFYGEFLIDSFGVALSRTDFLQFLVTYHKLISLTLYLVGFVWFVLSLVKRYYLRQFALFFWTHITLLIVVSIAHAFIQNLFEGIIWFIVPILMVCCNDLMAYVFGKLYGKTPLIQLSPKKTWEGFIGAGISTIIFGMIISHIFCNYKYFVCPVQYDEAEDRMTLECQPGEMFVPKEYNLPQFLSNISKLFGFGDSIVLYPFVLHSFFLSVFSSVIGPFGGFFASGFKRAFKIKDFGDAIPGHGGIMDRLDCMLLMALFVNVYFKTFLNHDTVQKMFHQIHNLNAEQQLQLYRMLQESLQNKHLL